MKTWIDRIRPWGAGLMFHSGHVATPRALYALRDAELAKALQRGTVTVSPDKTWISRHDRRGRDARPAMRDESAGTACGNAPATSRCVG
ncbi:MAG TPA: hypothetical protein VF277_09760 [Steroidobacteraceae bacterium]